MLISEQNWLEVKPEKSSHLFDLLAAHYREDTAIFCGAPAEDLAFGREKNVFIDCSALSTVHEHVQSDMVIAVETGITLPDLAELLQAHDQFFPVDMQSQGLRLIDIISSGDGGYLEQGYGYMRSLVLGLEVAYAGGKCAKLGGRVVKNVTGFDLTKLLVGGRGVFGVPYLAHLRLFARPPVMAIYIVSKKSAADLLLLATKLLLTGLPLAGLELVESGVSGADSASQAGTGGDTTTSQYALLISVMGSDTLVSSVSKQLRELASGAASEASKEDLARDYPALFHPASCGLEVSLSRAQAAALIDHLASLGQRGLMRYRPGMGRFYLDCPDPEVLEKSFELVCQFLSGTNLKTGSNHLAEFEKATVSKCLGPYQFSSHSPRAGDETFGGLVSRLRTTFDPLKCFNPGVTFHGY